MARLLLIANPLASSFTGATHRAVSAVLAKGYDVSSIWPDSALEARQKAAEAADAGFDVVAAMGGDGVVHHVANGLAGSETALAVIPAGTTNVLARLVATPKKAIDAAKKLVGGADPRALPLAALNCESPRGPFSAYATFAAGIGWDASVVEVAERRPHGKLRFGGLYYARNAVAVTWSQYRSAPANLRVEAEARYAHGIAVIVQLHDHYTYFGPVPLSVTTAKEDKLSALTLSKLNMRAMAALAPRLLRGRDIDGVAGAHVWDGLSKLVVEAEPHSLVQADGEVLGSISACEISLAAERLLIAG